MGMISPGIGTVWSMGIMSMVFWSVREKMLDGVKKGRVSDSEAEALAEGDQERSVEKASESNSFCPGIFPKEEKAKKEI